MPTTLDKKADLARPGIGNYADLEKVLPSDYTPLLNPRETQEALFAVKDYIEAGFGRELGLLRISVPLIVDAESGVNDFLDRDGSRTPIQFHISNDHDEHPIDAQVVQAATKFGWPLADGYPHENRAADYDDWVTETVSKSGKPVHGLNGDIKKAHLGEVSVTVWPKILKDMCAERHIHVLE